ncbi:hypothetical protein GCM10027169_06580 [Gordonia jinhuaensis]
MLRGAAFHGLAAYGDDALDQVVFVWWGETEPRQTVLYRVDEGIRGALRRPVVIPARRRRREHHDITGFRITEAVRQFVDDDAIVRATAAAVERFLHRLRGNHGRVRFIIYPSSRIGSVASISPH